MSLLISAHHIAQLWGQSYFLGAKIGFVTNFHGVMVLLRDNTPGRSSFILSSILPWTDYRLLTCLVGLSFIAVDEASWNLSILDMLCPQMDDADELPSERLFVLPASVKDAPEHTRDQLRRAISEAARNGANRFLPNVPPAPAAAVAEEGVGIHAIVDAGAGDGADDGAEVPGALADVGGAGDADGDADGGVDGDAPEYGGDTDSSANADFEDNIAQNNPADADVEDSGSDDDDDDDHSENSV